MCGKRGFAWQKGGMPDKKGVCVVKGTCVAKEAENGGGDVHGGGCAWQWAVRGKGVCVQERKPLTRAVHILLECILVLFISIDDGNFSVQ